MKKTILFILLWVFAIIIGGFSLYWEDTLLRPLSVASSGTTTELNQEVK